MHRLEIETTQNVGIEYPTASLVERLIAAIIDRLILIVYFLIVYYTIDTYYYDHDYFEILYGVLIIPVFLFYHLVFEYFNNGQSPGKQIMKIKVMQLDGSRPTLGSYFIRWIIGLIELGLFLGAPAMFIIMFTKKSQRIGDLAANTSVIKNKVLSMGNHTVDKEFNNSYIPTFVKSKLLNDKQAEVINLVLTNPQNGLRNRQIVSLTDKIKESLDITDDLGLAPKEFLTKMLDDYAFYFWEEENRGQFEGLKKDFSKILS